MLDVELIDEVLKASILEPNIDKVLAVAGFHGRIEPHNDFCLMFSEIVARQYLAGELSFSEADRAVSWPFAYSYVSENCPGEMPPIARQILEAFDEGEYRHPGDSDDTDPEKKYTLPQIRSILASLTTTEKNSV